jgi:EpsI family protein
MNPRFRGLFSPQFAVTVVLLSGTLAGVKMASYRKAEALARPLATIDSTLAGLQATENQPLTEGVLAKLLPTSYLSRTYRGADLDADVFIAYYAQQRAGESMHSPKHCLPGSGWEIWRFGSTEIPVQGRRVMVNDYSLDHEGQRMLMLYWYQSRNRIIASEYLGKILLARDALTRNSTAAMIVRIMVPDRPGTLETARKLAAELIPQVQRCFGK